MEGIEHYGGDSNLLLKGVMREIRHGQQKNMRDNVIETSEMHRRRHIKVARNSEDWRNTAASFALSGIAMTEENEEMAGRLITGEISLNQAIELMQKRR